MSVLWTWVLMAMQMVTAVLSQQGGVRLKQGHIFSIPQPLGDGRPIYSFRGIPYAKPPVGELRFMDPVAPDGWGKERDGTWIPSMCPQLDITALLAGNMKVIGDEDCLYLNVFTPKPFASDLPVMVYIHGGGFTLGSIQDIQPLPLLAKDIVLVTMQYRLGVLGFLSTEDNVMPGNLGMKDQILALQWVQNNIKQFGGNPKKVTLFGDSAGAASVNFHMMSPHSTGLFHQAILQSGNMLSPWSTYEDHREAAMLIGKEVRCPTTDSRNLLKCLKNADLRSLVTAPDALRVWNRMPTVTVPRIDGNYLPDHPAVLLSTGKYNRVPLMAGFNRDEAIMPTPQAIDALNDDFLKIGPLALGFTKHDGDVKYLARRAFYEYLSALSLSPSTMEGFTNLMIDRHFKKSHEDITDKYVRDSIYGNYVYLYELNNRGSPSTLQNEGPGDRYIGRVLEDTGRIEDLQFFNTSVHYRPPKIRENIFVSEVMAAMWSNFANTGNPTPDLGQLGLIWQPMSEGHRHYMSITTNPVMKEDTYHEMREFWRNMPLRENKILYPERFR